MTYLLSEHLGSQVRKIALQMENEIRDDALPLFSEHCCYLHSSHIFTFLLIVVL